MIRLSDENAVNVLPDMIIRKEAPDVTGAS